jgi:hypothetical protein
MATVEKRPLTPEETLEAERLRAAWEKYKNKNDGATQTWLASASGLGSQGAVGQYLRGIIPLNLKALTAICKQIEVDPRSISPRLMENLGSRHAEDAGGRDHRSTRGAVETSPSLAEDPEVEEWMALIAQLSEEQKAVFKQTFRALGAARSPTIPMESNDIYGKKPKKQKNHGPDVVSANKAIE